MMEGRFFGTMCLSEPHAGSSLIDISTRAEPAPNGTYRLMGNKMWISGGDHDLSENIIHLVLAKIPGGPPGVKGISLFIVPRQLVLDDGSLGERNDVLLTGLNHKMGCRGTINTLLAFGGGAFEPEGAPGAIGYLVGEPHQGLDYMFHMMNEARMGVGLMSTAIGYTGYLKSLDYARSRPQGRAIGSKDPTTPPVNIIEHADVRRMLLAQKSYVEGALALNLYCAHLLDESETAQHLVDRERAQCLLGLLTPIAKSWPAQWCLAANDLAIQVLGGAGYTRDYDLEQHYRDNRLNAIHEGTHGIQGLDLLGRKVRQNGGAALTILVEVIRSTIERAQKMDNASALAGQLDIEVNRLVDATVAVWATGDEQRALANATSYLEAVGHIVVAWIWLEQHLACGAKADNFYLGKRQAARYFFRHELPKVHVHLDLLETLDSTTVDMVNDWF